MQEQQIADRAHAYVELGKTDEAIEILGTGLVEFSESASLWSLLAWAQLSIDDQEAARGSAGRAIEVDPSNTLALFVLANLEIRAGATDRAHDIASRLLQLAPENPTAHLTKARAYAAEPNGAFRNREIIRQAAYYAVSLSQDDPEVLRQAALLLEPANPKPEVIGLVERGLALQPDNSDLQLMLVRLRSKNDVQSVKGWARILAGDPSRPALVLGMNLVIWERTRMLVTFMLWAIPAFIIPVAGLILVGFGLRNAWDLLIAMPRSMPRGALLRIWSTPRWARVGVVCSVISAFWPLLIPLIALTDQALLLAIIPLIMLTGETIVVLVIGRIERDGLPNLARDVALELVNEISAQAAREWARISLGIIGFVVGGLLLGIEISSADLNMVGPAILLSFAAAFLVPPVIMLVQSRRLHRECPTA